jgi:N-acyl-D-aspartate/D-glutamate deacylase/dipeptidyl aminopeptidase/acylaminoacyl peptidase
MKVIRLSVSLCLSLLSAFAAHFAFNFTRAPATVSAQQNSGFTLQQVLSAPFASDLVAAPTGSRVAWIFNIEGKRNIWVAEGPDFKARQLTQYNEDDGQEITEPSFTRDGKWIVYVRGGEENSAGEVPNPTSDPAGAARAIYAVSWDSGRAMRLAYGESPVVSPTGNYVVFNKENQIHIVEIAEGSEPHQLFAARGSNITPQWSPDGRKLVFNSTRNTHSLIAVYDFAKQTIKYITPSIDRDSAPRWSLDGKRIAFIRQPARANGPRPFLQDTPDPWTIWVADAESGAAREVWRSGNQLNDSYPRIAGPNVLQWAADDRLVFASEKDGWMRLYSMSVGGDDLKAITPASCEWESMTLTPDKREVLYSSNCGDIDRRVLSRVSVVNGGAGERVGGSDGKISWGPVVLAQGDVNSVVFLQSDAKTSGAPYVVSLTRGTPSPSAIPRPIATEAMPKDFPASALVTPQTVTFKAADGLEIHGQLFLPKDAKPTDKLPAVIFAHGGPMRQMMPGWHNMYYYHNTYGFNQYLASKGYAVLSVNYRLGIGYGRAFRQAKNGGGKGASEYQDILAGAHYLRARKDIDSSRIGLWGGSYGGFLTALGLARNSDLFAAGVDLHGVHDWSLRISNTNWLDYSSRDAVKVALESSPIGSVEKWRSPALFVHGDDDRNVAFAQTVDLVRRLRDLKVPHEVMVIPDEVHDFLLHRHWLEIFDAGANFFDKNLKGARAAAPAAGQSSQRVSKVDVLIRGGNVIDGSGADAVKEDVGLAGDRVVFVGDAAKENLQADRVIDAAGLTVAPGFIDPHTHTAEDLNNPKRKSNEPYLFQGVTTVVTGNDGGSPLPIGKTLDEWQRQGIGTNAALLVGHGSVRGQVLGSRDVQPTPEQLEKMKLLVRQAMEDGAIGMSTGLYYAPGSFAKTEEVIELSKVVAERGGVYDSHMRDESSYNIGLLGSIEEILRIGREARLPVHISHVKALGVDVWGQSRQVIDLVNRARAEGVDVTANQYPYTASGTSVTASLVPRWAEDGGAAQLLKRIDDPGVRPRLIAEMEKNLKRRGGAESMLLTSAKSRALVGKRLDAIAREWNKSPVEAALDIIKEGGAGVASFNMNERDIEAFMKQPWVMTGSDGSGGHPRKYGTFPRKIREYVLNRHVITMPRMIQASSAQVAETLKLKDRGKIRTGYFADVIVFDEKTIAERATYENPEALSVGMKYVIVNGKLAIDDGKYTGALAGRALRKSIAGE